VPGPGLPVALIRAEARTSPLGPPFLGVPFYSWELVVTLTAMNGKVLVFAAVLAALLVVGCGGTAGSSPRPNVPTCSIGRGIDGSTATLAISPHGNAFTGISLVTAPGLASGITFRYDVSGTASNGRLVSEWTLDSVAHRVTGSYTAHVITLDNPGGKISVTVFRSGTGCA
jgi:hypothetical protein